MDRFKQIIQNEKCKDCGIPLMLIGYARDIQGSPSDNTFRVDGECPSCGETVEFKVNVKNNSVMTVERDKA